MLSYREAFVMADKNTLRMCESLLEQLPMETTKPIPNPLWTFLKGIKGFDNIRAAECLGLLLDAQYDSIGVLKLATEQDLIEEAGLRPNDAIEVVSAVMDIVVHSNENHLGLTPTGYALPWAAVPCQPFVNPHNYVKSW